MIDLYFQPYGDDQQLNLNWIINEIINLHKQLDPDYETPSFTQVYPYSNLNRINLDWILSELKALKELAPEPIPTIDIQAVAEALVALPFDSNTSYQIYDFISRDGEIWRATEAIAAGGVWDETKWFKTKIGTDLAVLERWINAINNSLTSLQNTVADLSSADISDDSDAGGETVKSSLNNLKSSVDTLENDLAGLTSTDISDDSDAGGATVKASLNNLKGSLNSVQGQITANIETSTTATKPYIKGDYIVLNGTLYKVISPIANGAQITINTNVIAKNICEELNTAVKTLGFLKTGISITGEQTIGEITLPAGMWILIYRIHTTSSGEVAILINGTMTIHDTALNLGYVYGYEIAIPESETVYTLSSNSWTSATIDQLYVECVPIIENRTII